MERKLKAELWDKMHYLFRDFNDRMVHLELHYDYEINVDALKTVLICFLEKVPVLRSSFVGDIIKPYWVVKDYDIDDLVTVSRPDNVERAVEDFLTQYIPPENNLQIKVGVFFHEGQTVLCIVENHMCMDGGDFKYFVNALCKNYNDYVEKGITPIDIKQGSRSYEEVYGDFTEGEEEMARNLFKNVCAKDDHKFPLTEDSPLDKSFIAKRKLSSDVFFKIKERGKEYSATVNDVLVAVYFYSLYELADYDTKDSVTISCAIDLRRHIKNSDEKGITNHTAFMQCNIPERGRDIFETLRYVVNSSNTFKNDRFMGLYGLPLLNFGYSVLPHAASEEVIKIGYTNPLISMSNIGILDHKKLALEGHEPTDGYMTGAVKYKPFVLLSATSMRNEFTLCMSVKGNEEDKKIVERFFDLYEKNIEVFCSAK